MTPEQAKQLVDKYPRLFNQETEFPRQFYFECGPGWYSLIDTLCSCIQKEVDSKVNNEKFLLGKGKIESLTPDDEIQPRVLQIKEKFGGLRFYLSLHDETVTGMVRLAESLSYKICEDCGMPGTPRRSGWLRTLCDTHEAERQEKMKEAQ